MSDIFRVLNIRGDGGLIVDGIGMFLGAKLGAGIDREVYELALDTDQVIKIETGSNHFQNVMEFQTWNSAVMMDHPLKNHLAEVHRISAYGCWLMMERTWPPGPDFEWPTRMPAGLTDFKQANYGLTKDGRLVAHDYGTNILLENGMTRRMRKVEWW